MSYVWQRGVVAAGVGGSPQLPSSPSFVSSQREFPSPSHALAALCLPFILAYSLGNWFLVLCYFVAAIELIAVLSRRQARGAFEALAWEGRLAATRFATICLPECRETVLF